MADFSLLLRLALIGVLSAAVVVEMLPATAPQALPAAPVTMRADGRAATLTPGLEQIQAYVSTALARPLFRADRRPPRRAGGTATATAHGEDELPRLSGIVVSAAGATAIFEGGSKPLLARVGDRVGAFKVATIVAGSVTLDGPQGMQVMTPSFDKSRVPVAAGITPPPQQLIDPASIRVPTPPPQTLRGLMDQRRAMNRQEPPQQ